MCRMDRKVIGGTTRHNIVCGREVGQLRSSRRFGPDHDDPAPAEPLRLRRLRLAAAPFALLAADLGSLWARAVRVANRGGKLALRNGASGLRQPLTLDRCGSAPCALRTEAASFACARELRGFALLAADVGSWCERAAIVRGQRPQASRAQRSSGELGASAWSLCSSLRPALISPIRQSTTVRAASCSGLSAPCG
jgi:hypothetical protein